MSKINISYDKDTTRFTITVPFSHNNLVRGLPNKRWDSKSKKWTAPVIRANVDYMKSTLINHPMASVSDSVHEIIAEAINKYESAIPPGSNKFPPGYVFKTNPREKQIEALNRVYGNKAIALFMDMRTGKTKVVIDLICAMRMEGKADRALIISPLSIRKNWKREINIHSPFDIDCFELDTSKPKEFDKWIMKPHDNKWMLVGVESLASGSAYSFCERFLLTGMKTVTVIDESSKIKNHKATRTERCVSLGRMSETRVIMTGTPIANGPMDLYSQFEFLDPEIIGMGDYYSFRNRYAIMGGYENKQIVGYTNLDELIEIIEPYVFQVRKGQVFPDAPDKIYITRAVELTAQQKTLYRQMKKEKQVEVGDKSLMVQNALEKMLRLQEITGGLVSFEHTDEMKESTKQKFYRELIPGKNPKLIELMDCLEEYDGQTIIWCAYKEEIFMVAEAIRKQYGYDSVVELHGGVDEVERDINVNVKFQGKQAKYIVGNAATGGMGLTMSVAEIEIYYSNTFNYIDREQSEERAFGPDKMNGTIVIDLVAENTVDEHILEALTNKKDVSEYIRGSIDNVSLFGNV